MGNSQAKEGSSEDIEASPYVKRILEARQKLTGWERVKLIFAKDEFEQVSPELQRIVHTACISAVVGGLIGAIGRGRIAHMNFIKSHAHEAFESPLQAKRKLQDSVTIGMGAGAFRIGWRITFFTTLYMTISTLVSTYRGKMGVIDQVAGAGFAGFIYKFPQGPKAQVAGAVGGSLIGLSAGIMTLGLSKLTGQTIDTANLRYYVHLSEKENKQVEKDRKAQELLRKIDQPVKGLDDKSGKMEFEDLARFHERMISQLNEGSVERKAAGAINHTLTHNEEQQTPEETKTSV